MNTKTYQCSIGNYEASIEANSAQDAARRCVEKRMREFSWFANQSPELASVDVNGVVYDPRSVVGDVKHSWDFAQ